MKKRTILTGTPDFPIPFTVFQTYGKGEWFCYCALPNSDIGKYRVSHESGYGFQQVIDSVHLRDATNIVDLLAGRIPEGVIDGESMNGWGHAVISTVAEGLMEGKRFL